MSLYQNVPPDLGGTFESSSSRKWYFSWLKMRSTNPFESCKKHPFDDIWSILLLNHNGKISKIHFKTSCMTLVQTWLIPIPSYHKIVKTGLRPRFYLNCSHFDLGQNVPPTMVSQNVPPLLHMLNLHTHCLAESKCPSKWRDILTQLEGHFDSAWGGTFW